VHLALPFCPSFFCCSLLLQTQKGIILKPTVTEGNQKATVAIYWQFITSLLFDLVVMLAPEGR
jgi:hypothetical protein